MAESLVRVRDHRDAVIARLTEAYANDLFDVDELDRRLDLAHKANSVVELDAITADLAATPATTAPAATALVTPASVALDDPNRPADKTLRVIMGSVRREGTWIVPRHLTARVFWGNAELDFRDASLGSGITTIDVRVTMGALLLVVPPTLATDVDVSSFMGNVDARHRAPDEPDPARPLLRVTGSVIMGSVDVRTRMAGESPFEAWRRNRRERRERRDHRRAERRALRAGK